MAHAPVPGSSISSASNTPSFFSSLDLSVVKNGCAGGMSVATTVALFNFMDTLKTRWQIVQEEGVWRGLARPGLISNSISMGMSSAIRMGLYPVFRDAAVRFSGQDKNVFHMFFAGLLPGGIGYFCATPLYQVKNNVQAETGLICKDTGLFTTGLRKGHKPTYYGVIDCLKKIYAETQSVKGFFRGALPMTCRGSMLTSGQFVGYDGLKTVARDSYKLIDDGPILHVAAGLSGAFFAVTFCIPFDVIMVNHQTGKDKSISLVSRTTTLIRDHGPGILFRGWTPLFCRVASIFCVYMPAYEQLRAKVFSLGYFK